MKMIRSNKRRRGRTNAMIVRQSLKGKVNCNCNQMGYKHYLRMTCADSMIFYEDNAIN